MKNVMSLKTLFTLPAISAIAFMSFGAFGLSDHFYANQFLKTPKATNSWAVSEKTFTDTPKLPTNFKDAKLGYRLQLLYNFNANWYGSINATYYSDKQVGYGATLGLQGSHGVLRPYAELNYTQVPVLHQRAQRVIGYDVGASLITNKYVNPYFEADNFLQRDKEGFSGGINIGVMRNTTLQIGYCWAVQSHDDSASLKLTYAF